MKSEIPCVIFICLASAGAIASGTGALQTSDKSGGDIERVETVEEKKTSESISAFAKLALEAAGKGDLELAEKYYNKLLDLGAPDGDKKSALWQMAGVYEKKRVFSKAIAVYEKAIALFPFDPETPAMLLRLGLIYRETGAYQMAISKFYGVLNSTLKIDQHDLSDYKLLTQRAQFEIAETYYLANDYQQADKFYSLLKRLDLGHEDKAKAEYRSLYCRFLLNDNTNTINSAREFVRTFSDTKYVAECRYILAAALKRTNHPQEATDETLALLRAEKPMEKGDPENWIYWQKKTGNQIANDLYQQGDFVKALTIYQALAKLNNSPDWQLPVVYQIGLCFERLRLLPRSLEAYHFILDECKKQESTGLSSSLATLRGMAQWRSDQVAWMQNTDVQLQSLLGSKDIPADLPTKGL